ncbi:ATP-binding protein [Odoribacter sp. OttesenSCG-928-L07]|nr:ATP-binding protein [Odoribacter sp. OttesenSCG-928-L07]MDL2239695.1 ATP-binding protein [Bacteroidales bacterium OttesenSCG-928-L14]MDL2240814.1 ATP-binding protein [Bacteroidales bacterium OttesenSCG-928-K22]
MIERTDLQTIKSRMNEQRKFIQVISGPRQVGKTTLLKQALNKISIPYDYFSADLISTTNTIWISQVWENVRMKMKTQNLSDYLLVFDEIQKIDNWSEIVKKEWDSDSWNNINIKLFLCGSSRMLLQQGLTESLTGRFELINISHWSFKEMQEAFGWNVQQYIYYGAYPGAATMIEDEDRWRDYVKNTLVETSISKDILMLTRVDKPALLRQLFELGSTYSGQILSYNKILGQLFDAGNTTTLSHYLKLLDESGLLGGIEKYSENKIKVRSSSPKFQVYNNALITAQENLSFSDAVVNPDKWGRLSESAIGAHLINNCKKFKNKIALYYWRERSAEVDFVIKHGHKLIGLEVKSGAKVAKSGMMEFAKMYPKAKVMLVGTGGIDFETFLKLNPVELF